MSPRSFALESNRMQERSLPIECWRLILTDQWSVLCCAEMTTVCSGTFAACMEGDSFVRTFRVSEDLQLQPSNACALPGLTFPNSLAFDERGHLWGVAGVKGHIPFQISVLLRHQLLPEKPCEGSTHTDESAEGVCTDRLAQVLNAEHEGDRSPSAASELLPGTQVSRTGMHNNSQSWNHQNMVYFIDFSNNFDCMDGLLVCSRWT